MAEFTKEEHVQAIYDLKVGYTLRHADIAILKSMARQLLAGLEQEPVACIDRANMDYLESGAGADVWPASEADSDDVLLYAAPQLPQPAVLEELYKIANHIASCKGGMSEEWHDWAEEIESDIRRISLLAVPDEMTAIVKDEHDYVEGWNACRAAMLQGAEPVSQPDEVAGPVEPKLEVNQPPQPESKDGTVTVYPWLVSISVFEKDMRMWIPFSLLIHKYDDGLITKEDLDENLIEWLKGQIGDMPHQITFFGRMAPYQAPQQEVK